MNKIEYRICLAFRFEAFRAILSDSCNTHVTYIIFKDIKKTNKLFFCMFFFFYTYKNDNKLL